MRGSVGAGGGGSRRLPGMPHPGINCISRTHRRSAGVSDAASPRLARPAGTANPASTMGHATCRVPADVAFDATLRVMMTVATVPRNMCGVHAVDPYVSENFTELTTHIRGREWRAVAAGEHQRLGRAVGHHREPLPKSLGGEARPHPIHSGESLIAWVDRCGHAVAGMLQGLSRKASRSAVKSGMSCARAVAM